jgi:hypothetical protein
MEREGNREGFERVKDNRKKLGGGGGDSKEKSSIFLSYVHT